MKNGLKIIEMLDSANILSVYITGITEKEEIGTRAKKVYEGKTVKNVTNFMANSNLIYENNPMQNQYKKNCT